MAINNKNIADAYIELLEILRRLRAPGGCSWDQKQTSESLIPYLLEETYEIIEAIEEGDVEALKEELGDLSLHILFDSLITLIIKSLSLSGSIVFIPLVKSLISLIIVFTDIECSVNKCLSVGTSGSVFSHKLTNSSNLSNINVLFII